MSRFETAILEFIASETSDPALRAQLKGAKVTERKHTGVGCYTKLESPKAAPATNESYSDRGPITGPSFESSTVKNGGGSLLWFKDGRIHKLEIYTWEGDFPENQDEIVDFKLVPGPRDRTGTQRWTNLSYLVSMTNPRAISLRSTIILLIGGLGTAGFYSLGTYWEILGGITFAATILAALIPLGHMKCAQCHKKIGEKWFTNSAPLLFLCLPFITAECPHCDESI